MGISKISESIKTMTLTGFFYPYSLSAVEETRIEDNER